MIDHQGRTWTRNGENLTCEDGRVMRIVAAMTDAYLMALVQRLHDDATAAQATTEADADAARVAKADNTIKYLVTHTPAEIEAYVQANVTDLASARTLLGKLAVALSIVIKRELR